MIVLKLHKWHAISACLQLLEDFALTCFVYSNLLKHGTRKNVTVCCSSGKLRKTNLFTAFQIEVRKYNVGCFFVLISMWWRRQRPSVELWELEPVFRIEQIHAWHPFYAKRETTSVFLSRKFNSVVVVMFTLRFFIHVF